MRAAMAMLWQRHLPTNVDRVSVLEDLAVRVVEAQEVGDEQLTEAESAAHKLAGSLGTFGASEGTDHAREIEVMLRTRVLDAERLSQSVLALVDLLAAPMEEQLLAVGSTTSPSAEKTVEVLVISDDRELSGRLDRAAEIEGISSLVISPAAARSHTVSAGESIVVDLGGEVQSQLALVRFIKRQAPSAIVVVLADSDAFELRLAVARSGAVGYIRRSLPGDQMLGSIRGLAASRRISGKRVVVVDGDAVVADAVSTILDTPGVEVSSAASAQEFLSELAYRETDLVVIGSGLPDAETLEVCQILRSGTDWSLVTIMVLVEGDSPSDVEDAYTAGADDVMTKPLNDVELRNRARSHLMRGERVGQVTVSPSRNALELTDRAALESRLEQLKSEGGDDMEAVSLAIVGIVHPGSSISSGDITLLPDLGATMIAESRSGDYIGYWEDERLIVGLFAAAEEQVRKRITQILRPHVTADDNAARLGDRRLALGVSSHPDHLSDLSTLIDAAFVDLAEVQPGTVRSADLDSQEVPAGGALVDVVIVDDDDMLADLLAYSLESRGYAYHRFEDGLAAEQSLCRGEVTGRVILLDVGLPGMDGFSVLSSLRENDVLNSSRVMMLTARSGSEETLRALELGAADHVAKPFNVPVLLERVDRLLGSSKWHHKS